MLGATCWDISAHERRSMKKPDGKYLQDYLKEKKTEYFERDAVDKNMYDLYHGSYVQELPAHVKADPIQTGYATQFIDRVMGIFTHTAPSFSMEPTGEGDEAVKHTTEVETFLNALFPAMEQEADEATWHMQTQDVLLYGRGISQMPPAGSIFWHNYPLPEDGEESAQYNKRTEEWKKGRRLPLAWRHVPAMGSYPETDNFGLAEICTTEIRSLRRLKNEYPKKTAFFEEAFGVDNARKLSFLKYANREYLGYFVGAENDPDPKVLSIIAHHCGEVPYIYIKGKTSSSNKPEHATKSLLYHMRPLILYLEKLLVQKGTAIRIWCWPQLVIKRKLDSVMGDDGNPIARNFNLEAGTTLELVEGEDVSFLVWTGNPPDIDEQIAIIQRYLDRMGLSSVMYGTTASDASSGYAINTLIQAAQSLFGPIGERLGMGYTRAGQLALKNVELLGQRVYVYKRPTSGWISLDGSQIKGYYNIRGIVRQTLPQDMPAKTMMAMNLTQGDNPLSSMYKVRTEILEDRSPDVTERQILLEEYKRSPEARAWRIQKALKEADMLLEQPQVAAAQMQGPLPPALAQLLGRPDLAGPAGAALGGPLGQAGMPMAPGLGMPTNMGPQAPAPQAVVNAAERTMNPQPRRQGGRPAGTKRQPGGPKMGGGVVP